MFHNTIINDTFVPAKRFLASMIVFNTDPVEAYYFLIFQRYKQVAKQSICQCVKSEVVNLLTCAKFRLCFEHFLSKKNSCWSYLTN